MKKSVPGSLTKCQYLKHRCDWSLDHIDDYRLSRDTMSKSDTNEYSTQLRGWSALIVRQGTQYQR